MCCWARLPDSPASELGHLWQGWRGLEAAEPAVVFSDCGPEALPSRWEDTEQTKHEGLLYMSKSFMKATAPLETIAIPNINTFPLKRRLTLTICHRSSILPLRCILSPETRWWRGRQVLYLVCSRSVSTTEHTITLGTQNNYSGDERNRNSERLTLPWWSVLISASLRVAAGFLLPTNTEIRNRLYIHTPRLCMCV